MPRPSSYENAEVIRPWICDYDAILLRQHGSLTAGKNLDEALIHLERIEHVAEVFWRASMSGQVNRIPPNELEKLRRKTLTIHSSHVKLSTLSLAHSRECAFSCAMRTVYWEDNCLKMIDQRLLPNKLEVVAYRTHQEVAQAIKDMVVRGAPAIGAAAGFGLALAVRESASASTPELLTDLQNAAAVLRSGATDRCESCMGIRSYSKKSFRL